MSITSDEERLFRARLEEEVGLLAGLKAVEDWYARREREIWEPIDRELQRLQKTAHTGRARTENRARVARRLGADRRSRWLHAVYRQAIAERIGLSAEELTRPDSEAHRDIVEGFDAAWRELARK